VYPALAIVDAIGTRADVLWVGSIGGMEAALVRRAGVAFEDVPAAGVHGVGLRALPRNVWALVRGVAAARRIMRRFRPDVLLFTGGFVGVPVAVGGWGIPKLAYLPDIEPGLALRLICRLADLVAVTSEDSRRHLHRGAKVVVTGYPTRSGLRAYDRPAAQAALGLDPQLPTLLVFGGSKGARSINEALWGCLATLLPHMQVVHLTGELDWPRAAEQTRALAASLASRYHAHAYLHDEMGAAFAAADLAVSRAGASVLGELPLFGLPAILVPYPHAWRYQKVNAEHLAGQGAGIVLEDAHLGDQMAETVRRLLGDPERLQAMRRASRALARPQAAQAIAAELAALAGGEAGG
jgi:UDP-N-acetylglucosamine--N-acetylmuramyl-(pentapeptide) pyrophosphoryl-undecaprenol N-acetylglucosamine transferase